MIAMSQANVLERLKNLWCTLLGAQAIEGQDMWFALGGNSILLVRLVAEIEDVFGVQLEVADVLQAPSVSEVAELIAASLRSPSLHPKMRALGHTKKRIAESQERHYVFTSDRPRVYNIWYEAQLHGELDPVRLARSFDEAVANNGVFRYVFSREDEGIFAIPVSNVPRMQLIDLREAPAKSQQERLSCTRSRMVDSEFDLWSAPAYRAEFVWTSSVEGTLFFWANHILLDAQSFGMFIAEIFARYAGSPVLHKRLDFYDFAVWERENLPATDSAVLQSYWRSRLSPYRKVLMFSRRSRPETYISQAVSSNVSVNDSEVINFLRGAAVPACPPSTKVLASIALSVFAEFGERPLAFLYPVEIRDYPDAFDIVGNFLQFNIFVIDPGQDGTVQDWLEEHGGQLVADIQHRRLYLTDKEALLPAAIHGYGKCQLRFQFFDQSLEKQTSQVGNIVLEPRPVPFKMAIADVGFYVFMRSSAVDIQILYSEGLFSEAVAQKLLMRVDNALKRMSVGWHLPLATIREQLRTS